MMTNFRIRAMEADDAAALPGSLIEQCLSTLHTPGYFRYLARPGSSWTATLDGRPVGCAGFIHHHAAYLRSWALVSEDVPKTAWTTMTRRVRSEIRAAFERGVIRIDAIVVENFNAGHRWAELVGFRDGRGEWGVPLEFCGPEAYLASWSPDGQGAILYAAVAKRARVLR